MSIYHTVCLLTRHVINLQWHYLYFSINDLSYSALGQSVEIDILSVSHDLMAANINAVTYHHHYLIILRLPRVMNCYVMQH